MGFSLQHYLPCMDIGDDFLHPIVTRDKTWCHHFLPGGRSNGIERKHPDKPRPKKFKAQQLVVKVMLTAFFDMQDIDGRSPVPKVTTAVCTFALFTGNGFSKEFGGASGQRTL
ncbi:hypothetical protein TNCV_4202621 [Trichonephila clavipes]|uniref:Uncharacterized protein n=1 Tax=Trichonephila clavipes TaxID=2585209 RepID=A0A8X6S779_TRICX|nr:hypothetical protein TNCV_4202621 [Trichonephila clavipes]